MRRLPWVTFAIMASCVLMLLATDPSGRAAEAPTPAPIEEAAAYWRERPYLDAPSEVLIEVAYDVAPNQRRQYIGLLRTSADPPNDPAEIAAEQAELDAILSGLELPEFESPYRTWGLRPDDPTVRGFLAHMFMHAGWIHLLGNLFMLYLAGPALEDRWGRPLYGAFYLLAGIASGGFFLLMDRQNLPLVGASGAIAGVLGAFLVRYAKTKIRFLYAFFLGFRFLRGTFSMPAWAALPLWFGNELLAASLGIEDGVAYWAHVGGFVFGVGAGLGVRQLGLEERFDQKIESRITVRGNAAVESALALRESGDLEGAFDELRQETQRAPNDVDAALAFLDAAGALGRTDAAVPAIARTVQALLPGDVDGAARCWLELAEYAPDARLDPRALLAIHAALAAQGRDDDATRALRQAADPRNPALTPALALRVLDAARERDPRAAAAAARVALDSPHMPDEKKAKLRAQLAELEASAPPEQEPGSAARRREPIDIGPLEPDDAMPHEPAHAELGSSFAYSEREAEFEPGALDSGALAPELEPELARGAPEPRLAHTELEPELARADLEPPELEPELARTHLEPLELARTELEPQLANPELARTAFTELEPEIADDELGALLAEPRFQDVKLMEAVPAGLDAQGVVLALAGGKSGRIAFEKIQGVAVAAVGGLAPRPIVLVDLLMNWNSFEESALRVVRLRSDRFDPKSLTPGASSALDALRAFLGELLDRSHASPLPDGDAARAAPIRRFESLASYQAEVLGVG